MGRGRYSAQEQEFYRRYINSAAWRERKTARIRLAGGRCEFVTTRYEPGAATEHRCPRRTYLTVHHNTYERLGAELDRDLDVFCYAHHMIEHLLWKRCRICSNPCLGYDSLAEVWLTATLAQRGIDLDRGPVRWDNLPNKEQLAAQISATCMSCRGIKLAGDEEDE